MLHTLGSASHTQNELHALLPWLLARDQATVVRTSHWSVKSTQKTYLFKIAWIIKQIQEE